jgi:hypothetical protein
MPSMSGILENPTVTYSCLKYHKKKVLVKAAYEDVIDLRIITLAIKKYWS